MFHNGLNFVLFTFKHDTNIPSVEWQNLFSNHIYAKHLFAWCAKTKIKCYRFLHVTVTRGFT